jgi:hypothetical protein
LGYSICTTGDINKDGFSDIVLAAPFVTNEDAGVAYIIFGQAGNWSKQFNLTNLNGNNGFTVRGLNENDRLGNAVNIAGDVNNDGISDLVIGAYHASPEGKHEAGTAYIIFGHTGTWAPSFDLKTLNGTYGFRVEGLSGGEPGVFYGDQLGIAVSTTGDINKDGFDDIMISAYNASPQGKYRAGIVYVIFGQANEWPAQFNLTRLNGHNGFSIYGLEEVELLGFSVSAAGDFNGDKVEDFLIGSYEISRVYVIFGQKGIWPSSFNLTTLNGENGFVIGGLPISSWLGDCVNFAGDINGDGFGDIVLGAQHNSEGSIYRMGTSYVIFGQSYGWPPQFNITTLNGTNGFYVNGLKSGDRLGFSVSAAGDFNADGFGDLLLGADTATSDTDKYHAGAAYVIFGQAHGWTPSFDLKILNGDNGFGIEGLTTQSNLGYCVSAAGDVNRDGADDLLISAPFDDDPEDFAGTAYVIFGRKVIHDPPTVINSIPDKEVYINQPFEFILDSREIFNQTGPGTLDFEVTQANDTHLPHWIEFRKVIGDPYLKFYGLTNVKGITQFALFAKNSWNQVAQTNFSLSAIEPESLSLYFIVTVTLASGCFGISMLLLMGYLIYRCCKKSGYKSIEDSGIAIHKKRIISPI